MAVNLKDDELCLLKETVNFCETSKCSNNKLIKQVKAQVFKGGQVIMWLIPVLIRYANNLVERDMLKTISSV